MCIRSILTGQDSISTVDVSYWLIVVYFTVSSLLFHLADSCFKMYRTGPLYFFCR